MTKPIETGDALLIVDVQRDFLPGGSLAVPDGDAVVAPLNQWIDRFKAARQPIFATRDWHPADHCSFSTRNGPWPVHCVAASSGAQFADALRLTTETRIVSKAMTPAADAYSGFENTDLHLQLQQANIVRLFVGGLATDYCVLSTVQDARRLGYDVVLLTQAIRAVDVHAGDGVRAIAAMRTAGASLLEE